MAKSKIKPIATYPAYAGAWDKLQALRRERAEVEARFRAADARRHEHAPDPRTTRAQAILQAGSVALAEPPVDVAAEARRLRQESADLQEAINLGEHALQQVRLAVSREAAATIAPEYTEALGKVFALLESLRPAIAVVQALEQEFADAGYDPKMLRLMDLGRLQAMLHPGSYLAELMTSARRAGLVKGGAR